MWNFNYLTRFLPWDYRQPIELDLIFAYLNQSNLKKFDLPISQSVKKKSKSPWNVKQDCFKLFICILIFTYKQFGMHKQNSMQCNGRGKWLKYLHFPPPPPWTNSCYALVWRLYKSLLKACSSSSFQKSWAWRGLPWHSCYWPP